MVRVHFLIGLLFAVGAVGFIIFGVWLIPKYWYVSVMYLGAGFWVLWMTLNDLTRR
jgi:hypothetical protein